MIKIENAVINGWQAAIRGMRNPLESWDKSDSVACHKLFMDSFCEGRTSEYTPGEVCRSECPVCVGVNDLALMRRLANAGPDHGKFLRFITVTADIVAPRYWWTEYDTYKVGTVANSCSTMHKIHAKPFEFDDFSHEHLDDEGEDMLSNTIVFLNYCRNRFNGKTPTTYGVDKKEYWYQMIQLLPQSYNQRRTVLLNYQVLKAMYHARKNHKLNEWRDFCAWIETLPYSELITGKEVSEWIPVTDHYPESDRQVAVRYKAKDGSIKESTEKVWRDSFGKMYVTGGIGISHVIEWKPID